MYPTIEDVLSLSRAHVNDTFKGVTGTPGEGRIFTDDAPFILPLLNEALTDYQIELENSGITTKRAEIIKTGLTAINGPNGLGVADPSLQQNLGFTGFFDGLSLNASIKLPADLLVPLRLWQRNSGTQNVFTELFEAEAGLESKFQDNSLGQWEWRGDAIYWNGAIITKDARLRYTASAATFTSAGTPVSQYATTPLPFLDCQTAVAFRMAYLFCSARLPKGGADNLLVQYEHAIFQRKRRSIRRQQRVRYRRPAFGDGGQTFGWFG